MKPTCPGPHVYTPNIPEHSQLSKKWKGLKSVTFSIQWFVLLLSSRHELWIIDYLQADCHQATRTLTNGSSVRPLEIKSLRPYLSRYVRGMAKMIFQRIVKPWKVRKRVLHMLQAWQGAGWNEVLPSSTLRSAALGQTLPEAAQNY